MKKILIFTIACFCLGLFVPKIVLAVNCWCKDDSKGVCEHQGDQGGAADTEQKCNTWCSGKGASWRAVHFDQTYIDYSKTADKECGTGSSIETVGPPTRAQSTCPPGRQCLELTNPIEGGQNPKVSDILGTIINSALGVLGGLALLMLVWGGFQWLTSAGSPERITKGTQTMLWAVIGVILVLASYMVVSTFTNLLTGRTAVTGPSNSGTGTSKDTGGATVDNLDSGVVEEGDEVPQGDSI